MLFTLRRAMYLMFSLHNEEFCRLINEHESEHGEALASCKYFMLAYFLYKFILSRDDEISTQAIFMFASTKAKAMEKLCMQVHCQEGHVQMLRSVMQVCILYRVSPKEVEEQEDSCQSGPGLDGNRWGRLGIF